MDERTVSTKEAAERLGVGTSTVNRMIHRGELDAYKVTRAKHAPFRVYLYSIEEILEERRPEPTQ